jgi:hypothetical protein
LVFTGAKSTLLAWPEKDFGGQVGLDEGNGEIWALQTISGEELMECLPWPLREHLVWNRAYVR